MELVFYSAPDCYLCEVALARMAELATELDLTVRVVDISTDADLEHRYRSRIPVGEIQGRTAFKYQVDEGRVRRLVEDASADREGRFEPGGA